MNIAGFRKISLCMLLWLMPVLACMTGCGRTGAELIEAEVKTEQIKQTETPESTDDPSENISPEITLTATPVPSEIYVDVCGAVTAPGVYKMSADSRVFEAIEAAGGFLSEASGASINQAQPLSDGQQIYVPTLSEVEEGTAPQTAGSTEAGSTSVSEITSDGRVNLNTANLESLLTLPGIGESKAQAILSYREENGGFSSVEDIMQVPGIKEGTFAKMKDKLAVE